MLYMEKLKREFSYNEATATTPCGRDSKEGWLRTVKDQEDLVAQVQPTTVLYGDSIIKGLGRYDTVWDTYFKHNVVNCGIAGDRTQHVRWRIINYHIQLNMQWYIVGQTMLALPNPQKELQSVSFYVD